MSDLIDRQAAIDALTENKEMINAVLDSLTLDYNARINQEQRRGQINEDIETIKEVPSVQPEPIKIQIDPDELVKLRKDLADAPIMLMPSTQEHKIHFVDADHVWIDGKQYISLRRFQKAVVEAQPERKTGLFTGEEIKTIRSHMNAFKEGLCNQHRWKEAEEYQQIVDKLDAMMEVQDDNS